MADGMTGAWVEPPRELPHGFTPPSASLAPPPSRGRVYVDPVLVALSDALVMTALERGYSRVVPRSNRRGLAPHERHTAYMGTPIDPDRIDDALRGAWALCPYLAARHDLAVDTAAWSRLLDGYARALLMSCHPHETERLRPHLAPLGVDERWTRPYLAAAQ